MIRYLLLVLLLFLSQSGYSQAYRVLSTNTLYAEAGGLGTLYSLNYDKVFNWPGKRLKFNLGIGGAFLKQSASYYNFYTGQYERRIDRDKIYMIRTTLLYGKSPFFGGIGLAYLHDDGWVEGYGHAGHYWEPVHTFVPYLHFRYQPQAGGLFYAVNLNMAFTSTSGALMYVMNRYSPKLANKYVWPGFCIGRLYIPQ